MIPIMQAAYNLNNTEGLHILFGFAIFETILLLAINGKMNQFQCSDCVHLRNNAVD